MVKIVLSFIVIIAGYYATAQTPSCSDLHSGIFYFNPKKTIDRFVEIMDEKYEHERNVITGDTALWSVRWNGKCGFTSSYISGNTIHNRKTQEFLKSHDLYYKIENITADYFLFSGYVDDAGGKLIQQDTMWISEKIVIGGNGLFEKLNDTGQIQRSKYGDTSQYALLYIFRPKKFTNSLSNFSVYLDNNAFCIAKNNTGYVYKILKEGTFTLRSGLFKDTASLPVNIRFGKRYYIRSGIDWGMYRHLYNFKLDLAELSADEGSSEFEKVRLN